MERRGERRGGDCQAKHTQGCGQSETHSYNLRRTQREPRTFWRSYWTQKREEILRVREGGRIEWREGRVRERENESEREGGVGGPEAVGDPEEEKAL